MAGISKRPKGEPVAENRTREIRLRRAAERQGLRVQKSRQRDPRGLDFGTYRIVDMFNKTLVAWRAPAAYGLSLDEIEDALAKDPRRWAEKRGMEPAPIAENFSPEIRAQFRRNLERRAAEASHGHPSADLRSAGP